MDMHFSNSATLAPAVAGYYPTLAEMLAANIPPDDELGLGQGDVGQLTACAEGNHN